eukprot:1034457-Alexandrium_andersonii.AAC.1
MSASLVGSEMCIRDRRLAGVKVGPGRRQQLHCQRRRVVSNAPAAARPPVSYTHLTLPTICSV